MVVNLEEFLPASVVESYKASAAARGVSVADFVRDCLIQNAPAIASQPAALSGAEWEKALDELFDSFPRVGPLPDDAISRDSIYSREDNW
jgi:hypothetical protein